MKSSIAFVVSVVILFCVSSVQAKLIEREFSFKDLQTWNDFARAQERQVSKDRDTGFAYMVSGALLTLGGSVGYHNSKTSVEKLAYSLTQSLGVAGVGYGAYLYHVGNEHRSFYESVRNTTSLSESQRNDLFRSYAEQVRVVQYNSKWIRIVTHALVGALNFYNASREPDQDLRQGLNVIGTANALAAVSLSF
jgi:hypothetical protein